MTLHQPFVHDLAGVFAAPFQAWSTPAGEMRGEGAEGMFLADDRLISAYSLSATGQLRADGNAEAPAADESAADQAAGDISAMGFTIDGADTATFVDVISLAGMPADPLLRLTRTRVATPSGMTEVLEVASASDRTIDLSLRLELALDATPLAVVKYPPLAEKFSLTVPSPALDTDGAATWSWREGTAARVSLLEDPSAITAESAAGSRARSVAPSVVPSLTNAEKTAATLALGGSDAAPTLELTFTATLTPNSTARFGWELSASDAATPFKGVPEASLVDLLPAHIREGAGHDGAMLPAGGGARSEEASVGRLLVQSLADLSSLRLARSTDPDQAFLAAGAPWFFTLFGRDSLIAASFLAPLDPALAVRTVRTLAAQQGTKIDIETAEQPGKILHEVRAIGMDMGKAYLPPVYYGTIDATCLWVQLVGDLDAQGVDISDMADHVARAADWLLEHADADGDGLLEYIDESGHGLANQGWKDSGDSVRFADGTIAEGPIALSEVQAYAYDACLIAARLLESWGHERAGDLAPRLTERAARIKQVFAESFWVEDERGRFIALALDGHKRPVDGVASNMGHILGTGLLDADEERLVIDRLLDPTLFSGYGIRTLSTDNGAYWPTRYHGGSVWTHDSAFILRQALRAGFVEEAQQIARALLLAADGFSLRLPELFSGDAASEVFPPLPYPASCRPQAWAAASAVPIAQALGVLK